MAWRRSALAVVALVVAGCLTSCSSDKGAGTVVAVGLSTTTTRKLDVDDATPSSLPPVAPAVMKSHLDAALTASCRQTSGARIAHINAERLLRI